MSTSKLHYFGAHISTGKGLINAAKEIKNAGGNFMQIFLTSPKQNRMKRKENTILKEFGNFLKNNKMKCVVHSSYTLNIANDWNKNSPWIQNLIYEIEDINKFGGLGVVVHFGKQKELSYEEATNNMYTCLLYVLDQTKNTNVSIFLETTAGQGTEMCYKLEDLAKFYNKFEKHPNKKVRDRIALCVDSCHIYAAGYDIRDKNRLKKYLDQLNKLIGIKYIGLIHLNDSKIPLGGRVDRHENIGKGKIGFEGIKHVYKFARKYGIPTVLETPNLGYKKEINKLKNI